MRRLRNVTNQAEINTPTKRIPAIEPRIKGMVAEICIVSLEFLSGGH